MKVSDEFTVPLCRLHHREAHQAGNEVRFWSDLEIDALEIAKGLWDERLHKRKPPPAAERRVSRMVNLPSTSPRLDTAVSEVSLLDL
jgi:hypothetical protein